MGCLCAKAVGKEPVNDEVSTVKTYSWDEKRKSAVKADDYIIENLVCQEAIKVPRSIDGQQFIIQNCKDSTIYLLDYINTISIDDCINCKIILGPVEGSAFIRNCTACTCVVACGQFRMRDSSKINVFLFCATQPIIEASRRIHFGRYQLQYEGIDEDFRKANLKYANSNWKVIYDFTPVECEENWNFINSDKISDYISEPVSEFVKNELIRCGQFWSLTGPAASCGDTI
ncbi:hypothetical protein RUM44_005691 [Polyplax serrata]|uniref:C-CAP/cofactor C-like domain-containing protein n=1 Tax=Polyplax serrata TaxID=468196 RepID=A0ABR1AWC6_POLSC